MMNTVLIVIQVLLCIGYFALGFAFSSLLDSCKNKDGTDDSH